MIKGTSRQIVEVTDTANPYFERILLVVRNDCADQPAEQLDREAHALIQSQGGYTGMRLARRRHRLQQLGLLLAGGGIGFLLQQLLHL